MVFAKTMGFAVMQIMKTYRSFLRFPLVKLSAVILLVFGTAVFAQDKAAPKAASTNAEASKAIQLTTAPGATNAAPAETKAGAGKEDDDSQTLLSESERKRGPTFPGKDPAFLILPRPPERPDMRRLITPKIKEMSAKALDYLARAQSSDGSWSDKKYPANTGVTALSCLALMSEGSRPKVGTYGKQIDLGIDFLLKSVESSGIIAGKGSNPAGPMYEHSFSMLALLFAMGDTPHRLQMRDVAGKGLQVILGSQNQDGGWRYTMSNQGNSDLSVSGEVLSVLRTAKKCGFSVPREAIDKGMKFVEGCAMPDSSFRYRSLGIVSLPCPGGLAIMALSNQGKMDHPLIPSARDRVAYAFSRYTIDDLVARRYAVYGCFVSSFALFACGDTYYVPFYQKTAAVFERLQRQDGEIPDEFENTVYPTAMALIVLQSPRGYLPLYER
jgi:hypothetical protein